MFKAYIKRLLEMYFRNLTRIEKRYAIQRAMRTTFHGRYVIRSFDFGSLFLDTAAYEDDRLAKVGIMEPHLHHIFRTYIMAHSAVLDIGANSGFHSLLFSKIQRDKEVATGGKANRLEGKIFAFEPVPSNFRKLCTNLALNGNCGVEAINVAASDTSGTTDMNVLPDDYYWQGCHSLVRNEKLSGVHADRVDVVEIQTITIDEFFSERDERRPISFIKIDVEGAEDRVLRGALRTIKKHKPSLVVEFAPCRVQFLEMTAEIYEDLVEFGYRAFAIFKDGSLWEIDTITDYVLRGTLSDDDAEQRKLVGQNSGELFFVHQECFR